PGSYTVKLAVVDDAANPIETNRTFQVVVTAKPAQLEDVVGVCGCGATSAPAALLLWALGALAFLRGRRR
ncbi:MAG: hypothetical protein H6Q89_2169, partial [Myxococcaceae bacterium]|nr:hypothetical protein [Myxococcaceae bacterium]